MDKNDYTPALRQGKAIRSPLKYWGSKHNLVQHIVPRIPEHRIYVEPFCGSAAIFWAKRPSPVEILNDLNQELINFYTVCKTPEKYKELLILIDTTLHSRWQFKHASHIYYNPEGYTDVERAWAIWNGFLQAFGGALKNESSGITGASWAYNTSDGQEKYAKDRERGRGKLHNISVQNAKQLFHNTDEHGHYWFCKRLEDAQIECYDALKIIKFRDRHNTFFYCDPPYIDTDCRAYVNAGEYTAQDYDNLLTMLANISGKFMLSAFPNEVLDSHIAQNNWEVIEIEQTLHASHINLYSRDRRAAKPKKTELLVMNY